MSAFPRGAWQALFFSALLSLSNGAFINFQNCLDAGITDSEPGQPLQLQWTPLFVDAHFDTSSPNNLNLTIYGNVSGQQSEGDLPPPGDPHWQDTSAKFGKIADVGSGNNYSTLFADFEVLTYEAYNARPSQFCETVLGENCPLAPLFNANASNPSQLHSFKVTHDFGSPYMFSTLSGTIRVISGDTAAQELACITTNITPDIGPQITNLITWLPAVILILQGIATMAAAIWSPWGSSDIFRWSSNYGRDEDLLRLVTPGFGDCLQYIQFATLMGSLTLQFPGFFQPALSQTAWSLLLFNESFVSHGNGTQSLVDGVYAVNGTYGIAEMRQLIGMTASIDVWACMAIWLGVIAAGVIVLCQLGFSGRWLYRLITKTSEEDLRQKNIPFTLGNMNRLLFNFFILPIVALSLFQLVIATSSPSSVVGVAAVLFVILILALLWIFWVIFSTKPRTYLFDDMPTVLLYGPLYNTYSDSAAPFALVPVIITLMRGIAFGAVQPSGTAQIIILAICEVILIIALNGFRPFQNQTSMNAYHTFFAIVRLITVLLCVAFLPNIEVSQASKGWIGYAILLLHSCVLVFGFFLNSAQTLIEVVARMLGLAGHDAQTGAVRGSILNWRMLKKRQNRPGTTDRASMSSDAAMLHTSDQYEGRDGRTRSLSASSQQLLNQSGNTPNQRRISGQGNFSDGGERGASPSVETDNSYTGYNNAPGNGTQGGAGLGVKTDPDNFYRPPRKRTNTIDAMTPGAKSRSVGSADILYQDSPERKTGESGTESPAPAFFRDRADSGGTANRTDYAVREVDQYYRGTALSGNPTRKLKTGPADPTGPTASAQSWFQKLMVGVKGNKQKDVGKGFEVVRSSRMPPGMPKEGRGDEELEMETSPPMNDDPYQDSPEMESRELQAMGGAERARNMDDDWPVQKSFDSGYTPSKDDSSSQRRLDSAMAAHQSPPRIQMHPGLRAEQPSRTKLDVGMGYIQRPSGETEQSYEVSELDASETENRFSDQAPSLGPVDVDGGGGLDIPSRFNSRRSGNGQNWLHDVDNLNWNHNNTLSAAPPPPLQASYSRDRDYRQRTPQPSIPRRSSRRTPSEEQTARADPRLRSQSPNRGAGTHSQEQVGSHDFGNFDSGPRGNYPNFFDAGNEDDRPNSFFNASHHRGADSIHRNSFGANAAMNASSAEFMPGSVEEQGGFRRY